MTFSIRYSKQAQKDSRKIKQSGLKPQVEKLLNILTSNPWKNPPHYERLLGNFSGCYSRRINKQHRLIYEVLEKEKIVKVLQMWTHYE